MTLQFRSSLPRVPSIVITTPHSHHSKTPLPIPFHMPQKKNPQELLYKRPQDNPTPEISQSIAALYHLPFAFLNQTATKNGEKMVLLKRVMKNVVGFFLVGLVMVSKHVESAGSNHGAPTPAVDCSSLVLNMADCLSFVTSGSTVKKPEGTCCSGLKTVLKTDAECLCEAFKNSAQLGVTLNVTKAFTLPSACHVSAPSVSNCGLSIGSGAAPALSPNAMPPSSTAAPPTTFAGSNEVTPATAPRSSGSSALVATVGSFMLALVVAWLSWF